MASSVLSLLSLVQGNYHSNGWHLLTAPQGYCSTQLFLATVVHNIRDHLSTLTQSLFLHVCCTLCLPNALLSCEPSRLPHAFDTSLLLALYPFRYILFPSVELNSPHPDQLGPQGPHDPEDRALRAGFPPSPSPHLPCRTFSMLYSYRTVPCHRLPFFMTARQWHAQLEGDA